MAKMMRDSKTMGCRCCNDWESMHGRAVDKRAAIKEITDEAPFIPIWIDPRYVGRYYP